MQGLIQTKETTLETSTTSFLQKEKELQTKIEELENRVEEFNRSVALQKVYLLVQSNYITIFWRSFISWLHIWNKCTFSNRWFRIEVLLLPMRYLLS